MLTRDVLNRCLATIGERPLNAVTDPHPFKGAALMQLDIADRALQARGSWFNEETVTLQPSAHDGLLYIPGDALSVVNWPRYRRLTTRGRIVHDNDLGAPAKDECLLVTIRRRVPFDELPITAANYIGLRAVLAFQREYDGDSTKTRMLESEVEDARVAYNTEDTKQRRQNVYDNNLRLQNIKIAYGPRHRRIVPIR